jgi:hypothetical protein
MLLEAIIPLQARLARRNSSALPAVSTCPRRPRFARNGAKPARHTSEDAHLLLLLAEQEIKAGRVEQAESLIDAAYAAFDQRFRTY